MRPPVDERRGTWQLADISFDAIDDTLVQGDEFLFLTLASASFVEILADTYSGNLIEHFHDDAEFSGWLENRWQPDEVKHGRALKCYVQAVWPEFDWDGAHRAFQSEYLSLCSVSKLEPERTLELMARCVVETGTSSFYRALQHYVQEPVLRQLIENIKTDEIAHYNQFRQYFAKYNLTDRHGVAALSATIWRRLREIRGEDAYIALKYVYEGRYPGRFLDSNWRKYNNTVKRLARQHYPYSMAVKMLIRPLPILDSVKHALEWPFVGLARLISYV